MPKKPSLDVPVAVHTDMPCPLCGGVHNELFHQDKNKRTQRPYYQCQSCYLVYVPREFYLSSEAEKAEYDLHENQLEDEGYGQFLQRFWQPYEATLNTAFSGPKTLLEFGCGPGPLLAKIMSEAGYEVSLYDHFYQPDTSVLKAGHYHGISATEVIEHVFDAKGVFENWLSWLKPDGVLALMTKRVESQERFANWHYKNDLTHVCFYSEKTFNWLADKYGLECHFHGKDVVIFRKSG